MNECQDKSLVLGVEPKVEDYKKRCRYYYGAKLQLPKVRVAEQDDPSALARFAAQLLLLDTYKITAKSDGAWVRQTSVHSKLLTGLYFSKAISRANI